MRESATQLAPETLLGYEPTARTAKPLWLAAAPLAWSSGTQPARAGRPGWHHHAAPVVSGDRPVPPQPGDGAPRRPGARHPPAVGLVALHRPARKVAHRDVLGRSCPPSKPPKGKVAVGDPRRLSDNEQLQILALLEAVSTERSAMRAARALAELMGHLHGSGATYRRRAVRPGPRHQASQALVRSPALPDLVRPDWTVESRRLAVIS